MAFCYVIAFVLSFGPVFLLFTTFYGRLPFFFGSQSINLLPPFPLWKTVGRFLFFFFLASIFGRPRHFRHAVGATPLPQSHNPIFFSFFFFCGLPESQTNEPFRYQSGWNQQTDRKFGQLDKRLWRSCRSRRDVSIWGIRWRMLTRVFTKSSFDS